MKPILNMSCPLRIDGVCWCDTAQEKFHGVEKVIAPLGGKTITCSHIEEIANGENNLEYGWDEGSFKQIDFSLNDLLSSLFGGNDAI